MTSSSRAASATVRASGPSVDRPARSGLSGPDEIRPRLGLIPNSPHTLAGIRIEPPPSLPWAAGARPAGTAAGAPPLDPPAGGGRSPGGGGGGPRARAATRPPPPGRPPPLARPAERVRSQGVRAGGPMAVSV